MVAQILWLEIRVSVKIEKYDGGLVRFGDDLGAKICGIGSISFDGKHNIEGVYYIKGLRHNLLSIGKMCSKGYNLMFQDDGCEIRKWSIIVITAGRRTDGNVY